MHAAAEVTDASDGIGVREKGSIVYFPFQFSEVLGGSFCYTFSQKEPGFVSYIPSHSILPIFFPGSDSSKVTFEFMFFHPSRLFLVLLSVSVGSFCLPFLRILRRGGCYKWERQGTGFDFAFYRYVAVES